MRCQEIASELDAYLTGELDGDERAEVGLHIKECAGCRAELELLRKENAIYREYEAAIEIPVDASESVFNSGGKPESAIHWWRWAAAAAVLVAAILSWRFYATRHNGEMAGNAAGGQMTEIPMHQAVSSYEQAVQLLQAFYEGKKSSLDPALVRELDRNLQVAGSAVAECKLALKRYPHDPQIVEILLLDYEKQLGILKQITEAL
jgi:predicted anti-sigma-YlaC factor YlaD